MSANGALTVLVIANRSVWPVSLALAALSMCGVARLKKRRFPPLTAFLFLFLPDIILCLWGGANWEAEHRSSSDHWRTTVLNVLGIASVVFIVSVPVFYRREPRWWLLIIGGLFGLGLAFSGWLCGAMAITGNWL